MAIDLSLDSIKALPGYQKVLMVAIFVIAASGAFVWFVYIPHNAEIAALEQKVAEINNQINVNQAKARRFDELKRENTELARQLTALKEQLPPESEVASLLKQVSDLGTKTGLDFKLWKPTDRRPAPSGLYTEIPVEVEVAGGYHAVAAFFERIGKLPRIVNVSGLKMSGAKLEKNRLMIQTIFRATAFATAEGGSQEPSGSAPPAQTEDRGGQGGKGVKGA